LLRDEQRLGRGVKPTERLLRAPAASLRWLCALAVALILVSCGRGAVRTTENVDEGFADPHPSLLVTNPRLVASLELSGFSLGDVLGVRNRAESRYEDYSEESAAVLVESAIYWELVEFLKNDLMEVDVATPKAGVGVRFAHRIFDVEWLTSRRVHFELVGVANRIDFRLLVPPGCGQTRLVYRLAYQPRNRPETRLPLTVSIIYENRGSDCAALAREWRELEDGADLGNRLAKGPLASLDLTHFDRVETNVQSLRENSMNDKMDDHAEYIMRAFTVQRGHLVPDGLRNTVDVNLDPKKKAALAAWVGANVDAIEDGSAEVPAEFLATRAVSVTPRGLSRIENRPWKTLFPDEDAAFKNLPYANKRLLTSPAMLVRRLDEMTCVGCHESRSTAGFHLLGEDRRHGTFDAMTLGISEHLRAILSWRDRFLVATAAGQPTHEPVPFAERADGLGSYGAHCTLPADGASGLPPWDCEADLACRKSFVEGDPFGVCLPDPARKIGDPCESVRLESERGPDGDTVASHHADTCDVVRHEVVDGKTTDLCVKSPKSKMRCNPNKNGFPGGMWTGPCPRPGFMVDGGVCERIPHFGFEGRCFARTAVLEECLTKPPNFSQELLRTCSRTEPCREDFVCARMPNMPLDKGACVPPYFIFQTRVDGPPIDR